MHAPFKDDDHDMGSWEVGLFAQEQGNQNRRKKFAAVLEAVNKFVERNPHDPNAYR